MATPWLHPPDSALCKRVKTIQLLLRLSPFCLLCLSTCTYPLLSIMACLTVPVVTQTHCRRRATSTQQERAYQVSCSSLGHTPHRRALAAESSYLGEGEALVLEGHRELLEGEEPLILRQCESQLHDDLGRQERASDEGSVVRLRRKPHDELTVDTIVHATMSWDDRGEVVEVVRALDAGGEEAAKGRDERGEEAQRDRMQLDRQQRDLRREPQCSEPTRYVVHVRREDGWHVASVAEDPAAEQLEFLAPTDE
mmetsp:Transcript_33914/g.89225  ORF Transcript_33914/g.89225 Transcript_33914/m.89225 type:complete len:253 (-) Transcript_33914:864-1622(-)